MTKCPRLDSQDNQKCVIHRIPPTVHRHGVRIDQTFLFEIEMCGLRREDLNDKIRCSFRSPVGEKTAPPLGKEGQVRLENIDVSQNHIKRRIVEDPNRLCFAGGALDQIKLAYPTQPLRR
jgi:hypothetical protein